MCTDASSGTAIVCRREAYPDIRTVDYWVGDDKSQRFPQSRYVPDSLGIRPYFPSLIFAMTE